MNRKILVLGKGFIGKRIARFLDCSIFGGKIYTYEGIRKVISIYNPEVIINCIGSTGKKNVDDCEIDKDKTLNANVFVPLIIAEACFRKNIKLVHISSGCIYHYDYEKNIPLTEEDEPDFYELFYSRTKVYSEKSLLWLSKKANILITRIRIPLDDRPHPKNILDKLLKYKKIIDIPNSITYIPDFLKILKTLIERDEKGLFNIVCKTPLRYPMLLDEFKKYRPFDYEIIPLSALKSVRTNLILSTSKLESLGIKVRKSEEVIPECVKNYLSYL